MRIDTSDSPYTMNGETLLIVDATNGHVIVNLEDASSIAFRKVVVVKDDATNNGVELRAPAGNTISGSPKFLLTNHKESLGLIPDQNEWYKL